MTASGARCPDCNVCFRITAAQLCAAGGLVRCGFCLSVFDAGAQDAAPDIEPATVAGCEAMAPGPAFAPVPPLQPAPAVELPSVADFAAPELAAGAAAEPEATAAPAPEPTDDIESAPVPEELELLEVRAESAVAPAATAAPAPDLADEVEPPALPEPEVRELAPHAETGSAPVSAPVSEPEGAFTSTAETEPGVADPEPHPRAPEPVASPDVVECDSVQGSESESGTSDALAVPPWRSSAGATSGGKRAAALVASAALGALLVQGLYFHADVLDARPELQGIYRVLCGMAPCQRPPYRDLAAIAVDRLVVRASGSGTLRLDAMLTNRGRAAQPLPSVRLGFENLQGALIAARRFVPDEYLDGPPPAALAAGQSLHLVLELVDPGPDAVSYALAPVD